MDTLKTAIAALAVAAGVMLPRAALADDELYTLESRSDGYSYISIASDLDSFTFNIEQLGAAATPSTTTTTTGGGRGGPGGRGGWGGGSSSATTTTTTRGFGYFTYTDDLSGEALQAYIRDNGTRVEAGQTTIDVGPLEAGTRVGFFQYQTTTEQSWRGIVQSESIDDTFSFKTKLVQRTMDWRGNVTSERILDEGIFVEYTSYSDGGWMKISVDAIAAEHAPMGAPLPGPAALAICGLLLSPFARRRRKAA